MGTESSKPQFESVAPYKGTESNFVGDIQGCAGGRVTQRSPGVFEVTGKTAQSRAVVVQVPSHLTPPQKETLVPRAGVYFDNYECPNRSGGSFALDSSIQTLWDSQGLHNTHAPCPCSKKNIA